MTAWSGIPIALTLIAIGLALYALRLARKASQAADRRRLATLQQAKPGGILRVPRLTEEQAAEALTAWESMAPAAVDARVVASKARHVIEMGDLWARCSCQDWSVSFDVHGPIPGWARVHLMETKGSEIDDAGRRPE